VGAVPTIESLNAIAEAKQLADNATDNGDMDLLECMHLPPLERSVPIRYSVLSTCWTACGYQCIMNLHRSHSATLTQMQLTRGILRIWNVPCVTF
jgi:hypothetical protein